MIVVDSSPYAWPFDGRVAPFHTALVVCGAVGEWAAQTPDDDEVEARIDQLRTAIARWGGLVVLLAQESESGVPAGPARASVDLAPLAGEQIVVAAGIDGFYGSALDAVLQRARRSHLVFAGRGFETTVHSTLRRANDRGYECLTVADACATLDERMRRAAVSTIEMSGGIFGAVAPTSSVLHALRPPTTPTPQEKEPSWPS